MTQTERAIELRQRIVLAHTDTAFTSAASRRFHRLGYAVHLAQSGGEARRLANTLNPAVVVLDTDLADESGWLICDKLTREDASPKVILVGTSPAPEQSDFAAFVGASAYVLQQDGVKALVNEVLGAALPAAG